MAARANAGVSWLVQAVKSTFIVTVMGTFTGTVTGTLKSTLPATPWTVVDRGGDGQS